MEFSVYENREDVNKENVPPRDQTPSPLRSPFDLLVCKKPCLKSNESKGTHLFYIPSTLPFAVYEDDQTVKKAIENNVGKQKPLFFKNKNNMKIISNTNGAKVPEIVLEKRKPLLDIGQFVQPSIKYPIETDERAYNKHIDESSISCCVYTARNILNREYNVIYSSGVSLAAHWISCNTNSYTCELYSYFRDVEKLECPDPEYMNKQPDVTYSLRLILVDWLVEVAQVYMLHSETLYLAILYVDRYLSLKLMDVANLRLLGTAAMFVASKQEEIYHLDVSELVHMADDIYLEQQILNMAESIVEVLSFNVSSPTTIIFLKLVCIHYKVPLQIMYLAMYLAELTLLEADPYLSFMPSMVGCGAIALARLILGSAVIWPEEMSEITNYVLNDLIPVLKCLNQTYTNVQHAKQSAIRLKYTSARYHCVSKIEYKDLIIPGPKETSQKEMVERFKKMYV